MTIRIQNSKKQELADNALRALRRYQTEEKNYLDRVTNASSTGGTYPRRSLHNIRESIEIAEIKYEKAKRAADHETATLPTKHDIEGTLQHFEQNSPTNKDLIDAAQDICNAFTHFTKLRKERNTKIKETYNALRRAGYPQDGILDVDEDELEATPTHISYDTFDFAELSDVAEAAFIRLLIADSGNQLLHNDHLGEVGLSLHGNGMYMSNNPNAPRGPMGYIRRTLR